MALFPLQPRQPLIALALSAGAGIAIGDLFPVRMLVALGASVLAAGLLIWRPRAGTCCAFVAATFFALHVVRYHHNAAMGVAKDLATGGEVMLARGIICTDPEPPKIWTRNVTARFRMKTERIDFRGAWRPVPILMNVTWAGEMPLRGDFIAR